MHILIKVIAGEKDLHICFLSQELYPIPGGTGRYVYELSKALSSLGHDITIITKNVNPHSSQVESNMESNKIRILYTKSYSSIIYLFEVPKVLKKILSDIDLIHSQIPLLPDLFVRKSSIKKPIVETIHSISPQETYALRYEKKTNLSFHEARLLLLSPLHNLLEARLLQRSDMIIALSRSTGCEAIKKYNLNASKLRIVYIGVDHQKFNPYVKGSEAIRDRYASVSYTHLTLPTTERV